MVTEPWTIPVLAGWLSLPIENSDMRRYNPQAFYDLGGALERLTRLEDGARYLDIVVPGSSFKLMLALIQNDLNISNGCKEGAKRLERALNNIEEKIDKEKEDYLSEPIGVFSVKIAAQELDTLIKGECASLSLFYVPQVQAYDTVTLLEHGLKLIAPLEKKIATYDGAANDVKDAARCLAFGLWTASGFHIARATEALIQEYYQAEMKTGLPTDRGKRTWVSLVTEMIGQPKNKQAGNIRPTVGDIDLLKELHFIGDKYRNPLIHPEQSLTDVEGPLLFAACVGAIIKLLDKLP